MGKQTEAMALAKSAGLIERLYYKGTTPEDTDAILRFYDAIKDLQQQEPVAVPITSCEHRKFVLVGREWYERFAAFHDDCQIGEQLTWQEKTIRQQGYENGWNDAQRYLKEPQATSPTPAQQEPVAKVDYKQRDGFRWLNYLGWQRIPDGASLYTSPQPAREWVNLTDEEVLGLFGKFSAMTGKGWLALYRTTEARLKDKNA